MQFKRVFPFLLLAASAFAADAPQLTDAQKYQAMRLYTESSQLQEAQKNMQETSKNLQVQFQELTKACGANAALTFVPDSQGVIEPVCKPVPAPEPPKK